MVFPALSVLPRRRDVAEETSLGAQLSHTVRSTTSLSPLRERGVGP